MGQGRFYLILKFKPCKYTGNHITFREFQEAPRFRCDVPFRI